VLLALAALGGILLRVRPRPNALDRWIFDLVPGHIGSPTLTHVTDLAAPVVLVVATLVAGVVALLRRDRLRALACVAGPGLVALGVELVAKPLVDRRFGGVLSYPSGNVADVTAVATSWVLAVPPRLRRLVAALALGLVIAMAVAVVGLRWHYPTDAVGGALFGSGLVVGLDGLLHLRWGRGTA
jgi:membrane-associated phospholipid phosphatase